MNDPSSSRHLRPPGREKTFMIEIGDQGVGLAVEERGGYSFIASDARYTALDGKRFADLEQLRRRCGEVADRGRGARARGATMRSESSRAAR